MPTHTPKKFKFIITTFIKYFELNQILFLIQIYIILITFNFSLKLFLFCVTIYNYISIISEVQ